VLTVQLDESFLLSESDCELLVHEVNHCQRKQIEFDFSVRSPGYTETKGALSSGAYRDSSAKLELIRKIHQEQVFEQDRDEVVAEALELIADHLFEPLFLGSVPGDGAKVFYNVIRLWSRAKKSGLMTGKTKFDALHKNGHWGFGVWLPEQETKRLEESEGLPRGHMIGRFLDHNDLSREIVIQDYAPGMVWNFMWTKYAGKSHFRHAGADAWPPDPAVYFRLYDWKLGIG
jgi:hypothetical protein